ncbi:hypothetical protein H072_1898 [Dactylellina haptotyla CBS 200.50]|uniref:DUF1279 domain-containing protein n=1 Tax=Dactylellina haptotyla (strain CBS 200.50) TaxID=1284197 RepID=S8AME3_DACHA|nr:hypothetical protein H072_1898 [Dactylellina haptotyla CBS 200.50]
MAARPAAAALKRAVLSSTFFTSPAARRTNFLNPRYFTSRNLQSRISPSGRPFVPFSSVFNAIRTSKPARLPTTRQFSTTVGVNGNGHLTVGQRMRQLFKEYGMSAVGVYFLLSVLDFPFCFLFVKMVGTEKIAHYEHIIIEGFWRIMPEFIAQFRPKAVKESKAQAEAMAQSIGGDIDSLAHGEGLKGDIGAGSKTTGDSASLWTVLLLAYAVHKSLIFLRVPLTAAVTPKIVQTLRGWGFNIGKKGGVRQSVKDARANLKERRLKKGKKGSDDD